MFRRILLALLIASSMTLAGVSACEDASGLGGEIGCSLALQPCGPGTCCDGLVCGSPDGEGVRRCQASF